MDGCDSPMIEATHTMGQNLQIDFLPVEAEKTPLEEGGFWWLDGGSCDRIDETEIGTGLKQREFSGLVNKHQRGG